MNKILMLRGNTSVQTIRPKLGLSLSTKGNVPHSDQRLDFTQPILGYAYARTLIGLDLIANLLPVKKLCQDFITFILTNKLSGYPGNPPASRLPATRVITSVLILKDFQNYVDIFVFFTTSVLRRPKVNFINMLTIMRKQKRKCSGAQLLFHQPFLWVTYASWYAKFVIFCTQFLRHMLYSKCQ